MKEQQSTHDIVRRLLLGRFVLLLASLLLLFVFLPCLEIQNHQSRVLALNVVFLLILAFTFRAVTSDCRGWWPWGLLAWGLVAVALRWLSFATGSDLTNALGTALDLVLFSVCAVIILFLALRSERVTVDKVVGAICAYFLIGLVWALLFSLLEGFQPGAFRMPQYPVDGRLEVASSSFDMVQATYFSFTTLTTLGYGDISPAAPSAQALSSLEAATGQLFLAVLIARLVGLNVAHSIRANWEKES